MARQNKSLETVPPLGNPTGTAGAVRKVQVSFDIDANALLQVLGPRIETTRPSAERLDFQGGSNPPVRR